jgi:hypothetical protein
MIYEFPFTGPLSDECGDCKSAEIFEVLTGRQAGPGASGKATPFP